MGASKNELHVSSRYASSKPKERMGGRWDGNKLKWPGGTFILQLERTNGRPAEENVIPIRNGKGVGRLSHLVDGGMAETENEHRCDEFQFKLREPSSKTYRFA